MRPHARLLYFSDPIDPVLVMRSMGVDPAGIRLMAGKAFIQPVFLENVKGQAANILKQEMLTLGGEAAVRWDVSTFKARQSPVLLLGTPKQYDHLLPKLKGQPYGLRELGDSLQKLLARTAIHEKVLAAGRFRLHLGRRTSVMGILNVTPDSFSDGGRFNEPSRAVDRALEMAEEGADIIDIGGESTRPGSEPVPLKKELERVLPVVGCLAHKLRIPISIDTTKSKVAEECLKAGASLVNDTSALRDDPKMKQVVARANVPVVLMHRLGSPKTMQKRPVYRSVMGDILSFLEQRAQRAVKAGIHASMILVDPGFGFGKTREHNLIILKRLAELSSLGFPLIIGTSRKSFIGKTLELGVDERLPGSLATVCAAVLAGAHIVRVHDVRQTVEAVRMMDAVKSSEGSSALKGAGRKQFKRFDRENRLWQNYR